jgi:catechol 2,3-dioxygenase-like lactoylglutathione lyase family enzyme
VLQGLRTVIYQVDDIERAKGWYGEVLGKEPYFDEPFYVGFDVGGFELGATGRGGVRDVGESIRVASVLDPSGNVFGIIENPHFSLESA